MGSIGSTCSALPRGVGVPGETATSPMFGPVADCGAADRARGTTLAARSAGAEADPGKLS
jgi:hypothetical protein